MSQNTSEQGTEDKHTNAERTIFSGGSNAKRPKQNGQSRTDRDIAPKNYIPEALPNFLRPHLQILQPLPVLVVKWIKNRDSSLISSLVQNETMQKLAEQPLQEILREQGEELYEDLRTRTKVGRLLEDFRTSDSSIGFLRKHLARMIAGKNPRNSKFSENGTVHSTEDPGTITLKEYQHRVKNHLQQIISLIDLKRRRSKNNPDVILEQTIGLLQEFIQLNKNLDTDTHSDGTPVNMEDQIRQNIESLSSSFSPLNGETQCDVDVEPVDLSRNKIVPLGLIINELSMNSFQHGFESQETAILSISLDVDSDNAELRVQDNGTGLPDDFRWEETYGLTLVKELTEKQLRGSLKRTDNGSGAGWIVRFPLSDESASKNGQ